MYSKPSYYSKYDLYESVSGASYSTHLLIILAFYFEIL